MERLVYMSLVRAARRNWDERPESDWTSGGGLEWCLL